MTKKQIDSLLSNVYRMMSFFYYYEIVDNRLK